MKVRGPIEARSHGADPGRNRRHFRGCTSAAPLKREDDETDFIHCLAFPRIQVRGPIEAWQKSPGRIRRPRFPRV